MAKQAQVKVDITFPAGNSDKTQREEAYRQVANHFALLASMEANGMEHSTKANWFEGTVDVDVVDAPDAAQAQPAAAAVRG